MLNKFLKRYTPIVFGLGGGLAGLSTTIPGMDALGSALGATIGSVYSDFSQRQLSPTEIERIEAVFKIAAPIIEARLKDGRKIRQDSFFVPSPYSRSSAEEILEGLLQKVRNTYEDKKAGHFAKFYANLVFESNCSRHEANRLLAEVESLTYTELVLLSIFSQTATFNLNDDGFKDRTYPYATFSLIQSIRRLASLYCVSMTDPEDGSSRLIFAGKTIVPANVKLSEGGKRIFHLFDLQSIPTDDREEIARLLR